MSAARPNSGQLRGPQTPEPGPTTLARWKLPAAGVAAVVVALFLVFLVFPSGHELDEAGRLARRGESLQEEAAGLARLADDLEEEGRTDLAEAKRREARDLGARADDLFVSAEELVSEAERDLGADNPALRFMRGLIAFHRGDYARAERLLETVAGAPAGIERGRILTVLGTIARDSGDCRGAVGLFKQAIEADPQDAEAHFRLGFAYLVADSPEEALPALERAAALDPTDGEIQNTLGIAFERVLRLDRAESAFARAVLLEPGRFDFVWNLEELRKTKAAPHDVPAAWKAFEAGLEHEAAAWRALREARTDDSVKHLIDAAACYRTAIANMSNFHAAHYHRGRCYAAYGGGRSLVRERREYLEQAAEHFRAALTGRPKWAPYRFALAGVLRDLGRTREAEEVLRKVLRENPRSGRAHHELAYIHAYAEEDVDAARRELAAARRLGVEPDPVFLRMIDEIEAEKNALPETGEEKAARLAAEKAMGEGDIHTQTGSPASAAAAYARAYQALRGHERRTLVLLCAQAAEKAARAYERAMQQDGALDWYRRALELRPADSKLRDDVSRLEAAVEEIKRRPSDVLKEGARAKE